MTIGTTYRVSDGTITIVALPSAGDKSKTYKALHKCDSGRAYEIEIIESNLRKIDNLKRKIC